MMKKYAVSAVLLATLGLNLAIPALSADFVRVYTVPTQTVSRNNVQPVQGAGRRPKPIYLAQAKVSDAQIQNIHAILDRLKAANNIPAEISPKLKIQDSSQLNAATDGQTILITSGLL